jgi:hypothetical protein
VPPIPPPAPAQILTDLTSAHIVTRCLHVLADFGVADALGDEPATAAELAARTGMNADALERMLRLVAAHDVFVAQGTAYAHTPVSRLLRSDHPQSLRPLVRMRGLPAMWNGLTELAHAARTGQPVRDWASLMSYFAAHPAEAAIFDAAMVAKSLRVVPTIVDAYDFSGLAVVADIGGGRGHLLQAILERSRQTSGVLFDVPHVIDNTAGVGSPRLRLAAGDFFADPLPTADAYVLMDLLHDWSDADAAKILGAVRRAAPAHARVLIVETLVPEQPGPHVGKTLDIIMLAVTGGRERSPTEHAALLAAAGFRLERVLPTASQYSVVEAVVA